MLISPEIDIALLAISVTIIVNIASNYFRSKMLDKDHMEKLKSKQKELNKLLKNAKKSDEKRILELQTEIMELSVKSFRASMPVMVFSLAIFLAILNFAAPEYGQYQYPLVGHWLWYYVLISLATSLTISAIRKVAKNARF